MSSATEVPLRPEVRAALRCPICRSRLSAGTDAVTCTLRSCAAAFPSVGGIPILINEQTSLVTIPEIVRSAAPRGRPYARLRAWVEQALPSTSLNLRAETNYGRLSRLLRERGDRPRVLILGGATEGVGIRRLFGQQDLNVIETDIVIGPRTQVVVDAHDIPFEDGYFDGVVLQGVIQALHNPQRCLDEVHRVLAPAGLVYAETPFLQQTPRGSIDFTRFTSLGHRHLFRRFDEIESGIVGGPGMALAWAYEYFLLSFVASPKARFLVSSLARVSAFWLKYVTASSWLGPEP